MYIRQVTSPFLYVTYYYAGTSGTVAIITYTTQASFAKNVSDLTNFLDGLVITDQAASNAEVGGSTVVLLNDGKASLEYDNKKWRQLATTEDGHLRFALRRGDGFAVVEVSRIEVPFDALPNVVLNLAQRGDPNARITFKEKRTVNRVEVWFVKLDATTSGVPLTFYEYLYSSKAGAIQLITATGQNLIGEYEADFLEFLNTFRLRELQ